MKNEVDTVTSNTEMVTISRAEYDDLIGLQTENAELNQKLDWLMEQMRLTKKKLYGASSEQLEEELVGQLSLMFDETEAWLSSRKTAVKETKVAAQVKIREDVYFTYACQNCKQTGVETPILKTEKEPSLIPDSYASPEAVAHIMVQKFVMYVPLYRLPARGMRWL